jgi:hypothetical protein
VTTGPGGPRRSRLAALVQRFIRADSWPASQALVERHPALLSDGADDILTEWRALASSRGDRAAEHALEVHQSLLRRYREVGDAAFAEVLAPGVPAALRPSWIAAEAAYERYRARPSRAAADAAIEAITPVLPHDGLAAVPAAARAGMRQAAGTLHGERYQRHGGSPADLDAAVTCFAAAVGDLPDDDPDYPSYASALGNVLGMRFEERGDPADLDAAIGWSRGAAVAMPTHERWWILHNLSANLGIRYEMLGRPADLAEALATARDALASEPPETARTVLAHGVAVLLLDRYERDGALDDLRSCIDVARAAGSAGPRQERAALLVLLATALQRHAEHVSAAAELDEATGLVGDAVRLLGKRSPHLPVAFGVLGQLYLTRFEFNGTLADLLAAHDAYARALSRADPATPHAALLLSGKGRIVATLASLGLAGFSLDMAVSDLAAAASAADRIPRLRPFLLANLAAGLAARHRMRRRPDDLEAAAGAYRQACAAALTDDLEVALNAALDWGDWAATRDSWAEAARAYDLAFAAVDRLWRHQLGRPEKEAWLRAARRLGAQPGLVAARADELEHAAALLERGRARLLAESLELAQLDLSRLAEADADLARRFVAAADRLRGLDAITREQRSLQAPRGRAAPG